MMKLTFVALFLSHNPILFLGGVIIFMLYLLLSMSQTMSLMSPETDFLSLSLVFLSIWVTSLMILANLKSKNGKLLFFLMKMLMLALALSFFSLSSIEFYFFFEASLIPIFWIILGWGYQPERMMASLMMFFYTLVSSFPLLGALVFIWGNTHSLSFSSVFFEAEGAAPSWLNLCLLIAFLVKFPMFLTHLWLPKAHVEAPVSGSMILAGVLLKLGGYGLYRLAPLFFVGQVNMLFMIISIYGGSLLSILCCRISDMKVIIAYSSVVHMALIILTLLSLENVSLAGIWWVMLAHGFVSSGLFAGANTLYEQTHSRSMLINKGVLSLNPVFSVFWFLLLMSNFSGPFTLNLYGEVILMMGAISVSQMFFGVLGVLAFFSAAYSLVLYASSQQGLGSYSSLIMKELNSRELILFWGHTWPIFAILFNLSI